MHIFHLSSCDVLFASGRVQVDLEYRMRNVGALSKLLLRGPARTVVHQQRIGAQRLGTSLHILQPYRSAIAACNSRSGGDPRSSKTVILAVGTLTLSFAASGVTSVAWAKERPPTELVPKEVVLYQYEACPFCNKVKAFLDYHDIPYHVVEVNPVGKKELKWSDYKKVPVLVVDGEQLNDSTAIITILNQRISPGQVEESASKAEEDKWRRWVDDHLVHMLSPNIYRTPREALEAFDYITTNGNFTALERATGKYVGAAAMYFISKRLKKRHNITDARTALYEAVNEWVSALNGRTFMGGCQPNLADLAVFGVLRPIRHLQAGCDMVSNTGIGEWYSQMEKAVGSTSRLEENLTDGMRQPVREALRE